VEQFFRIVYGGLQGIVARMRPGARLQPHLLLSALDGMGVLDLPKHGLGEAALRRLTEQLLAGVVERHRVQALALVTPTTSNDAVIVSIGFRGRAKFFRISLAPAAPNALSLGEVETEQHPNLYLERAVTVPFDRAGRGSPP
jgi:hypothetical protein